MLCDVLESRKITPSECPKLVSTLTAARIGVIQQDSTRRYTVEFCWLDFYCETFIHEDGVGYLFRYH
jgi:hypothetical protein